MACRLPLSWSVGVAATLLAMLGQRQRVSRAPLMKLLVMEVALKDIFMFWRAAAH